MSKNISILIVDDDSNIRDILASILSQEGYKIETASDGEDAVAHLEKNRIDIILTDLNMPGMNGYELLKKTKELYPITRVIVMTSYGEIYSVKDSLVLGADEYLTKPFSTDSIVQAIEKVYWKIQSARGNQSDENRLEAKLGND